MGLFMVGKQLSNAHKKRFNDNHALKNKVFWYFCRIEKEISFWYVILPSVKFRVSLTHAIKIGNVRPFIPNYLSKLVNYKKLLSLCFECRSRL